MIQAYAPSVFFADLDCRPAYIVEYYGQKLDDLNTYASHAEGISHSVLIIF